MGIGKKLKKLLRKAAPIIQVAAPFIPGVGPLAAAAISAGVTKLSGGDWGDALKSGAMSGLGSLAGSALKGGLAQAFPETMSSIGGFTDSLGLGTMGLGGLGQAAQGASTDLPWLAGSSASTAAGGAWVPPWQGGVELPWQMAGGAAAPAAMPSSGSLFGGVVDFAKNNPLLVGGGALALMAGQSQANAAEDADQLAREQIAKQDNINAQNLDQWRQVLLKPGINRNLLDVGGEDFSTYGMRPSRKFFDNINPSYREGGLVEEQDEMSIANAKLDTIAARGRRALKLKAQGRLEESKFSDDDIATFIQVFGEPAEMEAAKILSGAAPSYRKGGPVKGKSGGQGDKIKANLSAGEFIIPADVVSHLGDGNTDAGAKVLQDMMAAIRMKKTGNAKHPPMMKETA